MGGQAGRLLKVEGIEYFEKKKGVYVKFKEDKSDSTYKFSEIKRELDKKVLSYYTKEIETQVSHYPVFCQSDSSGEILSEMKGDVMRMLLDNLKILDEMVYSRSHVDFDKILVKPKIVPSFGESLVNCLTDLPNFNDLSITGEKIRTSHYDTLTCICALSSQNEVATSGLDKNIIIHNLEDRREIQSLKGHESGVTCLATLKAYSKEIVDHKSTNGPSLSLIKDKHEHQQQFLVSGSLSPENCIKLWDLQSYTLIKTFPNWHKDSLTSLITLKDGHTIISASLDSTIKICDASNAASPMKVLTEHSSSVNCLYMMNNLSSFVSCGSDHKIIIYKLHYALNAAYGRTTLFNCTRENL